MNITFQVPAVPIAQPRPKARSFKGHARVYEAKKSHAIHDFKASVRMAANQEYKGKPLACPLLVEMVFVFPRPSNKQWKTRPMPREHKTSKPDADNLAKGCLDALNGLLFVDDSQVCQLSVAKFIASGGEQAHVEVSITEL